MRKNRKNPLAKNSSSASPSIDDTPAVMITSFEETVIGDFYSKIVALEHEPSVSVIPIIISSYGGDAHTLMALRDIIKSCSKPVATIALGKAMSAGACLLAAGTPGYRFASKHTVIMVHEVSSGQSGKSTDIQESALYVKNLNQALLQNLATDMGTSLKSVENLMRKKNNADWFITSKQAQKLGIIDHVMVPRLVMLEAAFGLGEPHPLKLTTKKKKP